jgi:transposase
MLANHTKNNHLGVQNTPRRSTFAEANAKRNPAVFEKIYMSLYEKYKHLLPDSQPKNSINKRLYIVDSSTITLFKEILKNSGRKTIDGKRKGGIKVHTLIKADEDVPMFVKLGAAAAHDSPFLKHINLPEGSIITFDKGYSNYEQYERLGEQKITWVTRIRKNAKYDVIKERDVSEIQKKKGVQSDREVILGHTSHGNIVRVRARLITFYDEDNNRTFEFITNNFHMGPATIALIYKKRWQIEVLFKRLKQNFPLRNFFGDNENAIRSQIWIALIADLLVSVIKRSVKRSWSFANLSSMIRIHLLTYTKLIDFLESPEQYLIKQTIEHNRGPTLFD